jgi:hypothetical protein
MRLNIIGTVIAVALSACSGSDGVSPREGCEQAAVELCGRFYTCFTAAELATAGYPASEAACVTMTQAQQGCAAQTVANACTGNETYHPSEAASCVDQIGGLSCSQVRDANLDINVAAPACAKVCVVN